MFEHYSIPAFFLCKTAVLTAYPSSVEMRGCVCRQPQAPLPPPPPQSTFSKTSLAGEFQWQTVVVQELDA